MLVWCQNIFWHLRKVFVCIKNSLIFLVLSRRHLKDLIRRFLKQVLLFDVCVEVLSDTFNLIHATLFSLGIGNQNKQSQWHFFSPIGKFVKIFPPLSWKCNLLSSQLGNQNALKALSYLKEKHYSNFLFYFQGLVGSSHGCQKGILDGHDPKTWRLCRTFPRMQGWSWTVATCCVVNYIKKRIHTYTHKPIYWSKNICQGTTDILLVRSFWMSDWYMKVHMLHFAMCMVPTFIKNYLTFTYNPSL